MVVRRNTIIDLFEFLWVKNFKSYHRSFHLSDTTSILNDWCIKMHLGQDAQKKNTY